MSETSTPGSEERPGEHGRAAEAGIVDQQDAVLAEIDDDEAPETGRST